MVGYCGDITLIAELYVMSFRKLKVEPSQTLDPSYFISLILMPDSIAKFESVL